VDKIVIPLYCDRILFISQENYQLIISTSPIHH